jgi:hypothetical protein
MRCAQEVVNVGHDRAQAAPMCSEVLLKSQPRLDHNTPSEQCPSVETEITHAKWLVSHGKGRKAVERIKALDGRLLTREGYEFNTPWWKLTLSPGI